MDNRQKQEDLEKDINDTLGEEDTSTEDTTSVDETTTEDIEDTDTQEDVGSEDVDDTEDTETEEDTQTEEEEQPSAQEEKTQPEPDYKEKFRASTQEAQILNSKNSKFVDAVEKAAQLSEVDEAELRQEYSDWDDMTPSQQKMARDNLLSKKQFGLVHEAVMETRKADEWAGKVDEFLDDDTQTNAYPGLAGREQEFKAFATKPTRVGVDIGDLVSAFLYSASAGSKGKKGSLLLSGGNSGEFNNKPKKLNEEDAAALRKKSPRQYMDSIKSGKIDVDI